MSANNPSRDAEREIIAFGRPIEWEDEGLLGTVFFGPNKRRQFPPLPVGNIKTLIDEGYLEPTYQHNNAPTAEELIEFVETLQGEYASLQFEIGLVGYMTSPDRSDSRIALEGFSIRSPGPIPEEVKRKITKRFSPDLLTVDDFYIEVKWD